MEKNIISTCGEKIIQFRKRKGLSQEDLGHLIGKGRTTIVMYENNKIEPTVTILNEIAKALGISIFDFLVDLEDEVDRFLNQSIDKEFHCLEEELENKIKRQEIELVLLKIELRDKAKEIEFHEQREADYEKRLKDIRKLYAKIIKKFP